MRGKKLLAVVIVWCVTIASVYAIDYPHNASNSIGCDSCHFVYGTQPSLLPPWTSHVPQDIDDTQYNTLCWSCHNDIDAPYVKTHSSLQTDNGYGNWTVECRVCHNPHYQMQFRTYGSASYLYSGASTHLSAATITKTGAGWAVDAYAGLVVVPNVLQKNYNYKILINTTDTLTVQGPINLTKATIGNTFAIVYGKLIKESIATPNSGSKAVRFFNSTGTNSFADGNATFDGVCEVCHSQTTHFRNNGSGPEQLHTNIGAPAGTNCITCHSHENGFRHGSGGGTGCGDASSCHGTRESHPTHVGGSGTQLSLACSECHNTSNFPEFKDGQNLANTTACDPCHSPGGTYDGVNNANYGVKNNWTNGVYIGSTLKTGKDRWCASCHDESPSEIQGVIAPNVVGDEDGSVTFETGWGYYKTGHKMDCSGCHDVNKTHIDGEQRSYNVLENLGASRYSQTPYFEAYRLKSIEGYTPDGGENYGDPAILCFSCHNSDEVVLYNPAYTDFESKKAKHPNLHYLHLYDTGQPWVADSDFDGDRDSAPTCTWCHNVHGGPNRRMIRGGELQGSGTEVVPNFGFDFLVLSNEASVRYPAPEGTYKIYFRAALSNVWETVAANALNGTNWLALARNVAVDIAHTESGTPVTDTVIVDQEEWLSEPWVPINGVYTFASGDSVTISTRVSADYVVADAIGFVAGRGPNGDDFTLNPATNAPDIVVDDTDLRVTFVGNWDVENDSSCYEGDAHFKGGGSNYEPYPADSSYKADAAAEVKDSLGARFSNMGRQCAECHVHGSMPVWERLPDLYPRVLDRHTNPSVLTVHDTAQMLVTARVLDHDDNIDSVKIDLSPMVGGASEALMHDDGINGDEEAGDGIFTALITIDSNVESGQYTCTITARDSNGLTGTNTIDLIVVSGLDRIVDDDEAEYIGDWLQGGGDSRQFGQNGYKYKLGSPGDGNSTAAWHPDLALQGRYKVYIWNFIYAPQGWGPGYGSTVNTVTVGHGSGVTQALLTVVYAQCPANLPNCYNVTNDDMSGWIYAGEYDFDAGSSGYVSIDDLGLDGAGWRRPESIVAADAVLFKWVGGTAAVSGRVVNAAGSGIQDVTITVTSVSNGTRFSATTEAGGYYKLTTGVGSYVIVAGKQGYAFTPNGIAVDTISGANLTDRNFTAAGSAGGNSAPTLQWTGEANYTADGVNPNSANTSGNFAFRVKYVDSDDNLPELIQVWVDGNDNGTYEANEKHDLSEVDPVDINCTNGKLYSVTLLLGYAGDNTIQYRFYAKDWTREATGVPTTGGTIEIAAMITQELLLNPGFETGDATGWSTYGGMGTGGAIEGSNEAVWRLVSPHGGNHQAYWSNSSSSNYACQSVDLTPFTARIDSGALTIDATGWFISAEYNTAPEAQFYMRVLFYDMNGVELTGNRYDTSGTTSLEWAQYGITDYPVPAGTRAVEICFNTWDSNWKAGAADDFSVKVYTTTPEELLSIDISPLIPYIIPGAVRQFTATGLYSDGSSVDMTSTAIWSSSDAAVATVDSAGMVTAQGVGIAEITAHIGGLWSAARSVVVANVSGELLVNPGFESGTTGWTAAGGGTMEASAIPANQTRSITTGLSTGIVPHGGSNNVWWSVSPSSAYAYQNIDLAGFASDIDAGRLRIDATGWFVNAESYAYWGFICKSCFSTLIVMKSGPDMIRTI